VLVIGDTLPGRTRFFIHEHFAFAEPAPRPAMPVIEVGVPWIEMFEDGNPLQFDELAKSASEVREISVITP
jgi:hypothetical protein